MKIITKHIQKNLLVILAIIFLNTACSNGQTIPGVQNLSPVVFSDSLAANSSNQLLDVRTPEEYNAGHLLNAKNINWNGGDFLQRVNSMDKTKPVYLYCLSGARSSSAAAKMHSEGFTTIYTLDGGIMKWRAANLPEAGNKGISDGMTITQFRNALKTNKIVLVDFYADWCAPCKKMKPYLDEITKEMSDKVVVMRVDADKNKTLTKALKVSSLPVLHLYKNEKLIWSNDGYITKEKVVTVLNENK